MAGPDEYRPCRNPDCDQTITPYLLYDTEGRAYLESPANTARREYCSRTCYFHDRSLGRIPSGWKSVEDKKYAILDLITKGISLKEAINRTRLAPQTFINHLTADHQFRRQLLNEMEVPR